MSTQARPGYGTLLRDFITAGVGWAIFLKQAGILWPPPPEHPSEFLIGAAVILVGTPVGGQVWQAISGRQGGTPASSPQEASPPSSPSQSGER